jgi:hypothetical protein
VFVVRLNLRYEMNAIQLNDLPLSSSCSSTLQVAKVGFKRILFSSLTERSSLTIFSHYLGRKRQAETPGWQISIRDQTRPEW